MATKKRYSFIMGGLTHGILAVGLLLKNCKEYFLICNINFLFCYIQALWTKNGSYIVYPCHAIIVSTDVSTGQQQFFMGHTDKVLWNPELNVVLQ